MKNTVIVGGRVFRVEFNWNALADYCELSGLEDISKLDSLSTVTATDMRTFIFCAIKEGERMEKREFDLSPLDLGAMLRPADIAEIMKIYANQTRGAEAEEQASSTSAQAKKKRPFRFRLSRG